MAKYKNAEIKITYFEFLDAFSKRMNINQDKIEDIIQYSLYKNEIDQTPKEYYEHQTSKLQNNKKDLE